MPLKWTTSPKQSLNAWLTLLGIHFFGLQAHTSSKADLSMGSECIQLLIVLKIFSFFFHSIGKSMLNFVMLISFSPTFDWCEVLVVMRSTDKKQCFD